MAALIERIGEIDLATRLARRSEERPADAYGALLRAIVGQQLSTKAARTIYLRVLDLFDGSHARRPSSCSKPTSRTLRGAGLSGRKVEYLRDLAAHVIDGELELDRLDELGDEEAIDEIVAVRGLGQLDGGDVPALPPRAPRRPLRRRPRHPQGDPDRVRAGGDADARSEVVEIGEPWRPHRSLASLYLWESLARGARTD